MEKNNVLIYFTLLGDDFDADYVTQKLGVQPIAVQNKCDLLKSGKMCGYTAWKTGMQEYEESTNIEIQLDKVIAPFLDKVDLLSELRQECSAEWQVMIVMNVEEDNPPFIGFTREQMKFFGSIEAEVEFDTYLLVERAEVKRGPNYRIIETGEPFVLRYEIFNRDGDVVKSGAGHTIPSLNGIGEDVTELSIRTGIDTKTVQFYSAKHDMFSDVFDTPIVITDELIGLLRWSNTGALNLIVRDMFDTETYCNEFLLEDFSNVANPMDALIQVEYLGNGELEVIYLSGQNFIETATILAL